MIATIMSGEADTADVFFLIGLILAIVAAIAYALTPPWRFASTLICAALACLAFGWLAL